jgi:hypothetical protein
MNEKLRRTGRVQVIPRELWDATQPKGLLYPSGALPNQKRQYADDTQDGVCHIFGGSFHRKVLALISNSTCS